MARQSQISGFSKTAKSVKQTAAENRAEGRRAKRREPGEAPSGYDQDIWTLAIKFQAYSRKDKIELATDLPVIHDGLADVVTRYKVRDQKYLQEVRGCRTRGMSEDMAERCWYHWPPHDPAKQAAGELTWVQFMEVVMAEFWSRIWDGYALDGFRQYFAEYANGAWQHWKHLRIAAAVPAAHHPGYLTRHGHARMPAEARRDA